MHYSFCLLRHQHTPGHSYTLSSGDNSLPSQRGHVRGGSAGNWATLTGRGHLSSASFSSTGGDSIASPWTATELTMPSSRLHEKTWAWRKAKCWPWLSLSNIILFSIYCVLITLPCRIGHCSLYNPLVFIASLSLLPILWKKACYLFLISFDVPLYLFTRANKLYITSLHSITVVISNMFLFHLTECYSCFYDSQSKILFVLNRWFE